MLLFDSIVERRASNSSVNSGMMSVLVKQFLTFLCDFLSYGQEFILEGVEKQRDNLLSAV
jgi:hypothetical protein